MDRMFNSLYRGFTRVFPDRRVLSQAIAFNMFLAFFPMLLLVLGILSSHESFHGAVRELPERLRMILLSGSEDVVVQYFTRKGQHPWKWFLLGLAGTLLAGSQVMAGLIEGFRVIECDEIRQSYWRIQSRALLLLVLTIVPSLVVIILTVFGRQARGWLIHQFGFAVLIRALAFIFQVGLVFGLSMIVLVLLYRIGRPGHKGFMEVLPGAAIATVLWWVVDIGFGVYVRKMPYNVVYGGLAAAIGLLLWMYLTAIVV